MRKASSREIYEIQAGICRCLASAKRLEIIHVLSLGELPATEIADELGISCANASQHLAIMRDKGILKSRREGVSIFYSIANPKVITACNLMREVLFEHLGQRQSLAIGPTPRAKRRHKA
jgi:ArsR family transcriptional regulator